MVIIRKILGYEYTRMISLPKYWLEQQGLKPKDRVELIIQKDGSLLIIPCEVQHDTP